jgi:uncharacterized protein YaiL (DUF2058 family)
MSLSLREQLLAAGLGTKKQAKQAETQERQQRHKERHKDKPAADAARERAAQQAQAAKAARDQELNRQRQIAAEKKEKAAQIKQLIEQNRLPKLQTDEYFNFIHRQKVHRIAVDADLRARIMNGQVVLVRCEGKYDMVLPEIAEKIRERDERAIVVLPPEGSQSQPDENDPYKDFVVPDDLKW